MEADVFLKGTGFRLSLDYMMFRLFLPMRGIRTVLNLKLPDLPIKRKEEWNADNFIVKLYFILFFRLYVTVSIRAKDRRALLSFLRKDPARRLDRSA